MRNCIFSTVIYSLLFATTIAMAEEPETVPQSVPQPAPTEPVEVSDTVETPAPTVEPETVVTPLPVAEAAPIAVQPVAALDFQPRATVNSLPADTTIAPTSEPTEYKPRHRWVGLQLDLGVPDGATAGVVVRPYVEWVRVNLSATYNGVAPGIRGAVTLDPINFGIAPTLTLGVGHAFKGNVPSFVPSASDIPAFDYTYFNLHPGLEFGNRNSWRFFIQGGPTWLHVNTFDFRKAMGSDEPSLRVVDPSANARINPTVKLGLATYF